MIDVEGAELETVEITVRLGRAGFERLSSASVPCSELWLTEQPDGSFALGVVTPVHPEALGYEARRVEVDDRRERFAAVRHDPMREAVEALVDVMPYLHPNPNALHAEKWAEWKEAAIEKAALALADKPEPHDVPGAPSIDTLEGLRYLTAVRAAQTGLCVQLLLARGPEDSETLAVLERLARACAELAEIVERKDWANEDGD